MIHELNEAQQQTQFYQMTYTSVQHQVYQMHISLLNAPHDDSLAALKMKGRIQFKDLRRCHISI